MRAGCSFKKIDGKEEERLSSNWKARWGLKHAFISRWEIFDYVLMLKV